MIRDDRIPYRTRACIVDIQNVGARGLQLHNRRPGLFKGDRVRTDDGHIVCGIRTAGCLGRRIAVDLIECIVGGIVELKSADVGSCIVQHHCDIDDDLFAGRNIDADSGILDHYVAGRTGVDRGPRLGA